MLYTFGGCHTYGLNFTGERKKLTWPNKLAELVDSPLVDYSFPGTSNWRVARILANTLLHQDDIVIIGWTDIDVFEFGVNNNHSFPILDVNDKSFDLHNRKTSGLSDLVESNNGITTKRFYNKMIGNLSHSESAIFTELAYSTFYNLEWFKSMFKIMLSSTIHILEKADCRWLMYNTVNLPLTKHEFDLISHPNYIIDDSVQQLFNSSSLHMSDKNNNDKASLVENLIWNEDKHDLIARTIHSKLLQIGGKYDK